MIIEKKKLSELTPAPYNPRQSTAKQEKQLKASLEKFGVVEPIIFNKQTGYIVGGHFRVRELKKLGYKEIECVIVDLNEEDEKELNIRLNANTGEWDWDMLANEWDAVELEEWGLEVPNFEAEEQILEAEEDDYDVPDGGIETDIVIGDLFEIGEHRLLCGDSTDSDAVAKLMNGELADVGHNDPPYGMKKEKDGVLNDNLNFDDLLDFNRDWIALQFMHLKENGSFYCWGIDEPLMDIYSEILKPYIKEQKATFRNFIKWQKSENVQNMLAPSGRSYSPMGESCLFIMLGIQGFKNNLSNWFEGFEKFRSYYEIETKKAGLNISKICNLTNSYAGHYFSRSQYAFPTKEHHEKIQFYCKENQIDAFKKEYETIKKEYETIKKEYETIKKELYNTRAYFDNTHDKMGDVWHFERTNQKERHDTGGHATPKPIRLCQRAIKSSCPENGLVLDFFLGSGSTMVAAHQLKRKCYGLELEPKYCQVIIDRMKKLDPTLTIKRNGQII
jgi:DNA modification methylase